MQFRKPQKPASSAQSRQLKKILAVSGAIGPFIGHSLGLLLLSLSSPPAINFTIVATDPAFNSGVQKGPLLVWVKISHLSAGVVLAWISRLAFSVRSLAEHGPSQPAPGKLLQTRSPWASFINDHPSSPSASIVPPSPSKLHPRQYQVRVLST